LTVTGWYPVLLARWGLVLFIAILVVIFFILVYVTVKVLGLIGHVFWMYPCIMSRTMRAGWLATGTIGKTLLF
jgi:hypothetical protein